MSFPIRRLLAVAGLSAGLSFLPACESVEQNLPFAGAFEREYRPLSGALPAPPRVARRMEDDWSFRRRSYPAPRPSEMPPGRLDVHTGNVYWAPIYQVRGAGQEETHIAYWDSTGNVYYVNMRGTEDRVDSERVINRWFGPYPLELELSEEEKARAEQAAEEARDPRY